MNNYTKYAFIFLFFIIAITNKKNAISKRDYFYLSFAMFFTLIADYFLVIKDDGFIGVFVFILVQLTYIKRYDENRKILPIIITQIFIFCILVIISSILNLNLKNTDIIGFVYGFTFINTLYSVIKARKNLVFPLINGKIMLIGMFLFFLCDVNVGLHNTILPNNYIVLKLIWIFYLPAQFLLCISGRKNYNIVKNFFNISNK